MFGIITLTCEETDHSWLIGARNPEEALESLIDTLNRGRLSQRSLQDEWNEFGEDAFEIGIPEVIEEDDEESRKELLAEWMEIMEEVEAFDFDPASKGGK